MYIILDTHKILKKLNIYLKTNKYFKIINNKKYNPTIVLYKLSVLLRFRY